MEKHLTIRMIFTHYKSFHAASCSSVYPAVRGSGVGAANAWREVHRAAHHVSAGGHRCSVLQSFTADAHSGEHALRPQCRANHSPVHQPVDERHRVLPRVHSSNISTVVVHISVCVCLCK